MPLNLVKNACLARSGIYYYTADELHTLDGLGPKPSSVPEKRGYNVLRPATVLARTVQKFTHLPLTHNHAPVAVTPFNIKDYQIGWSGDVAVVEPIPDSHEVGILSEITLSDVEALEAYQNGERQLSPQYVGVFDWEHGYTKWGEEYDIVMKDVKSVNHLAQLRTGRGGPLAAVMDHAGGAEVKFMSGLWRAIAKKISGVKDEASFDQRIQKLVADKAALTSDQVSKEVDGLQAMCQTLPESKGKEKVTRFIEDMRLVKDMAPEHAKEAATIISKEYQTLDAAAMEEVVAPKPTTDDDVGECPDCHGTGKTADGKDCATCDGTGKAKAVADDAAPPPDDTKKPIPPAPAGTAPAADAPPGAETPAEQPAQPAGGTPPAATAQPAGEMAGMSPERAQYWMGVIADSLTKIVDGIKAEISQGATPAAEPAAGTPPAPKDDAPPASPPQPTKTEPKPDADKGAADDKKPASDAAPPDPATTMSMSSKAPGEALEDHFNKQFKGGK